MLEIGQPLAPLLIRVETGPMKTMAVLLRDPNPIHWDVKTVQRLGLGDRAINQGPINVGYLSRLAGEAAGGVERVQRITIRFLGNVYAGNEVLCTGRVVGVEPTAGVAHLDLKADVDGRAVLTAKATVSLA
jgi:acyl dehydratase